MLAFSAHLPLPVLLKVTIAHIQNVRFGDQPSGKVIVAEVGAIAYNKLALFIAVRDTIAVQYADSWISIATLHSLVDTVSTHASGVVVFFVLP